jgi:serine/threonine protein phosphatase PrpC
MSEFQDIRLLSLSLVGRKHKDKNKPCEDASLAVRKNGVSVVCLSDGAGSSEYSNTDIGSQCVVQTVCDLLTKHFDAFYFDNHEALVRSVLVAAIQSEMTIRANEMGLKSSEALSATMLFCAVKDSRVLFGHIGDGVIARVTGTGLQLVTIPQNGEDISSTIFITLPHAQNYLRLVRTTTDDTHALVLMTDGISDLVYDNTKLLLMPVVARLAEFGSLPLEDGEAELKKTIESFVITPFPLSDDASIGIMYFEDTPKPDPATLPSDKEVILKANHDNICNVQHDILPRVQKAREIITQQKELETENTAIDEEEKISEEVCLPQEDATEQSVAAEVKEEDIVRQDKPLGFWKRIFLAIKG